MEKGANLFGKIGECSGLKSREKPISTPILTKNTPPKPIEPIAKDGDIEEPTKAPPQKQVWIPKPNHLRNPFDTLLDISENLLPKAKQPTKVYHAHQRESKPPKREVKYHCEYCKRDGHHAEFCFRRKRDERQECELKNRDMYHPSHGVHVPLVQRHSARPRGAMPQGARSQAMRPRDGRARRSSGRGQYDFGFHGGF